MEYNEAADITYGSVYFLCFLIGTVGNSDSFLYFKSKKRDISSVIYMMITANDIVINVAGLPVGISLWQQRKPGLIFGNKYGCAAWIYVWDIAVAISIFLVICLSITRTISLISPFKRQKVRYLILAVLIYFVGTLVRMIWVRSLEGTKILHSEDIMHCNIDVSGTDNVDLLFGIIVERNIVYIAPAFVVATSCVISAVLLTRRNENVQPRELQQSRNRATVTILLFALLYGVCNIPLVADQVLLIYFWHANNLSGYWNLYKFDTQSYLQNFQWVLLLAVNSAVNPILYFWRMPTLGEYTQTEIRRILRLNRETRRPDNVQSLERGPAKRAVKNTITPYLPATASVQTRNL